MKKGLFINFRKISGHGQSDLRVRHESAIYRRFLEIIRHVDMCASIYFAEKNSNFDSKGRLRNRYVKIEYGASSDWQCWEC